MEEEGEEEEEEEEEEEKEDACPLVPTCVTNKRKRNRMTACIHIYRLSRHRLSRLALLNFFLVASESGREKF